MSGVVQCFSVKKGEVVVSFKSLPGPQKVCVQHQLTVSWLGGAAGRPQHTAYLSSLLASLCR